jgi:putative transposase
MRRRKQIRLREYDYSLPGAYFVTICTKDRRRLFGGIVDGRMVCNEYGAIVHSCWDDIPVHYPLVQTDELMVMPNHIHGIIIIDEPVGAIHKLPLPCTRAERRGMLLPKILGRFKMNSVKRINIIRNTPRASVWQRGYYDHIIRSGKSLNRIRDYISTNPEQW